MGQRLLRECDIYYQSTMEGTNLNDKEEDKVVLNKHFNHNIPDCALIVSGKQIYCHKFILSRRCPILHEMIAAEERPQSESECDTRVMTELLLPKIRFEVGEAMVSSCRR